MYKSNTQLIITDLWAAAAAHKLGFEVESFWQASRGVWVKDFCLYMIEGASLITIDKWRITVTESGPNAAERFLPQVDDLVDTETPNKTSILGLGVGLVGAVCEETNQVKIYGDAANWRMCKRIIKRNGIPFPQFSEVIEP